VADGTLPRPPWWLAPGEALAAVGGYVRFSWAAWRAVPFMDGREALRQAYDMGVGSILVVATVCAFAGAMLTVQGAVSLQAFGAPEMLGMFVAVAGVREVFPLVAGGCVGAKVGSAMAAEMATLRAGHQLDALEVMGLDPARLLVAPRLVASVLTTPLLMGAGLCAGLGAGYLTATLQLGVDPGSFLTRGLESLSHRDLAATLVKGLLFGSLIGSLACWYGHDAGGGPEGVGQAANQSVVRGMMVGAVTNLVVSHLFFGGLL
jgi:phospholipid/cholesterol/gamma-HCH transport system permease protein